MSEQPPESSGLVEQRKVSDLLGMLEKEMEQVRASQRREEKRVAKKAPYWLNVALPLALAILGGVVAHIRLEGKVEANRERLEHHAKIPYHEGISATRDSLIEIKAELRHINEKLEDLEKKISEVR